MESRVMTIDSLCSILKCVTSCKILFMYKQGRVDQSDNHRRIISTNSASVYDSVIRPNCIMAFQTHKTSG